MRLVAALLVVVLAGLAAAPAHGQRRPIEVQITAHLRSDYRFSYDFVDRSRADCHATIKASSRVVTEMTTVRPARFRIVPLRARGRTIYDLRKNLSGSQRGTRSIDMEVEMTRSTEGGQNSTCEGYEPYPTTHCGTRRWALDGTPRMGPGEFHMGIHVPPFPSIQQVMEDDQWRGGGCGYDSTNADDYITNTRNEQGELTPSYTAPISLRRLFRPGRRTLRLRKTHPPFSTGRPDRLGGGDTQVRTVEVTIRKLR
jgi:hypothetical protein